MTASLISEAAELFRRQGRQRKIRIGNWGDLSIIMGVTICLNIRMEQEINPAMNIFHDISLIGQLCEESIFQRSSSGTVIDYLGQEDPHVARGPLDINSVLDTNNGFLILI
jgi:hypothetical protein